MDERVARTLERMGLCAREIEALDLPRVHNLPDQRTGFGLIGPTGTGKTAALAQWFGDRHSEALKANPGYSYFTDAWLNWPEAAEHIKRMVVSKGDTLEEKINEWKSCPNLVMDDLGQERIKGDEDYSQGILREILDYRYRNKLRLFWTSNLEPKAMQALYGARITGRILEAWPPIVIKGADLRTRRPA